MDRIKTHLKRVVVALVAIIIVSAGMSAKNQKAQIARNLDIFNSLYKELQVFYVDSIDAEKSINTAINAMLNDIDPYTVYISAKDQDDFKTMTTGEYGGIGSIITERKGKVYVSEPYENWPAHKSGLKAGDLFLKIDGDTVDGWRSSKVSERLKGQPGTSLVVMVKRPYAEDSIVTVNITREKIQMPAVTYYGVTNGDVGYIALSTFTTGAAKEVKKALEELRKDPRVKSIALDLRGNGGGLLEEAVKIVGLFVPKNTEVLRTKGKGHLSEKVYKTTASPIDTKIPLAVLIDGGSASSSEIVAGALQDLDRAVIVGSRSYGKGLVQSTRQLPYDGLLKVTIAKYYIPSGRLIQAIDYSHRNADGSVARTPDSLTSVFKTKHGREVRDGGGITPDSVVTYPDVNRLTYNIVRDFWAFDYATRFAATTPSIATANEFVITDSIFDDFKKFIDPEKFEYDKVCEVMLKELREQAETEGYMNDSIKAQFDVLETMLKHNLDRDLDKNRAEIESILADEIVARYYYQRGQMETNLRYDLGIKAAAAILQDNATYCKILSPKKK